MQSRRWLLGLLMLGSGAAVAAAQTFVDTTQVVVVEVPVQVIRDGEPVRGLTAADFEVYGGREKQTLTGFEAVDLAELGPEALATAELPASARRHFLILYDLAFSSPEALLRGRRAAQSMVSSLHPTDLVAVATWSARQGPRLILGFTADRAQIAAAVESLGIPDLLDNAAPDPLRLALVEGPAKSASPFGMKGTDATMEETYALITRLSEESRFTNLIAAVRDMSRTMKELAQAIGGVTGRKNVVFLSEGFDPGLLQSRLSHDELQARAEKSASGEIWAIPHGNLGGHTPSMNAVESMLEELRRADCVIQAVDIAGLRGDGGFAGDRPAGQDMLLNFAKGTGGELYEKTNDLGGAMQQMLRRTGVTYVLSFQPEKVGKPGAFRSLKVKVKNQPRGTRVVHRPGWYAPKPYTERSSIEKAMSAARRLLDGEDGGPIRTALLAVPVPGAGGKARVQVVVEVDGTSLLAGTSGETLPVEIYVYALDKEGAVHGYIAQTVGFDPAKVGAGLQQSGIKITGHLDLPPGEYRLRSLVRNGATGASTVRSTPFTVQAFSEEPQGR